MNIKTIMKNNNNQHLMFFNDFKTHDNHFYKLNMPDILENSVIVKETPFSVGLGHMSYVTHRCVLHNYQIEKLHGINMYF